MLPIRKKKRKKNGACQRGLTLPSVFERQLSPCSLGFKPGARITHTHTHTHTHTYRRAHTTYMFPAGGLTKSSNCYQMERLSSALV